MMMMIFHDVDDEDDADEEEEGEEDDVVVVDDDDDDGDDDDDERARKLQNRPLRYLSNMFYMFEEPIRSNFSRECLCIQVDAQALPSEFSLALFFFLFLVSKRSFCWRGS